MPIRKRDIAETIGFKLNRLNHMRISRTDRIYCSRCRSHIEKGLPYAVEFGIFDLHKPIVTPVFTMYKVKRPVRNLCIPCSKIEFPELYRKEKLK